MNALVMRLETRADQAAAAGENDLAALLWEAAAALALSPSLPAPSAGYFVDPGPTLGELGGDSSGFGSEPDKKSRIRA